MDVGSVELGFGECLEAAGHARLLFRRAPVEAAAQVLRSS